MNVNKQFEEFLDNKETFSKYYENVVFIDFDKEIREEVELKTIDDALSYDNDYWKVYKEE